MVLSSLTASLQKSRECLVVTGRRSGELSREESKPQSALICGAVASRRRLRRRGGARESARPADDVSDLRTQSTQLKRLAEVQGKNKDNADDIATLSRIDPTVGTVMAFAREWPPKKTQEIAWTEKELGWLKCDGRSFAQIQQELGLNGSDLDLIKLVLGGDSIPDFQGYFLRGIDREVSDPTMRRDPEGRRSPGSHQLAATARPANAFTTDSQGAHNHDVQFEITASRSTGDVTNTVANQPDKIAPHRTSTDGAHTHTVAGGGDPETHPINVAVHWIIKFKSK